MFFIIGIIINNNKNELLQEVGEIQGLRKKQVRFALIPTHFCFPKCNIESRLF